VQIIRFSKGWIRIGNCFERNTSAKAVTLSITSCCSCGEDDQVLGTAEQVASNLRLVPDNQSLTG
jgi:hypothetical protein